MEIVFFNGRFLDLASSNVRRFVVQRVRMQHAVYNTLLNAGINVWASQKLKTNLGPVINSFGVRPLKKLLKPSFFIIFPTILKPLSGLSKFRFCIRVLMTSNGADTSRDADAPAIDATKF